MTGEETNTTQGKPEGEERAHSSKMVPESDLLAVKAAREGLERKLQETESQYRTQVSELGTKLSAAEAKAAELEAKYNTAASTLGELEVVKKQLETAQGSSRELETKALEYRRGLIAAHFNVPADTMKEKTMQQLDSFEEALRVVGASRGAGNYAVGGGGIGPKAPESSFERAQRIISETEERQGLVRPKEKAA